MKAVELEYGRQGLEVILPDNAQPRVIRKPPISIPGDPHALIDKALAEPIASVGIKDLAQPGRSACILICDITRPVPNGLFLRKIVDRLIQSGVALSEVTILVATGLHRPNLGGELAELIGDPWVLKNVRILNHDARDDAAHIDYGYTSQRRTPVLIDRTFAEADIKIATGLVEPHFMAGWSGGRKVIAPGVAHHSTIRTFHSARFMEDPAATSCNLVGNPLHKEQLEIVGMIGGDILALNTVIDEHRNLVFASFGEVIESHRSAVEFVQRATSVTVDRRFKTIVTSAAGYPLDATYYQTVKGMVTPIDILEPGGDLIIVSECSEGVGSPEFRAAQERLVSLGPDAFLETLTSKALADIDEWQTEMQLRPMRIGRIALYAPALSDADHAVTGVERIGDLSAEIAASIARHGDNEIAVIPEGPYLVPFFNEAA